MKKNLFFALIACVALVFVSCEQKGPSGSEEPGNTPITGDTTSYVVTLSETSLTLGEGQDVKLTATVTPVVKATFVWTTSNPEVVTVSPAGIVEAVGVGSATITVTLKDVAAEKVTPATCEISVVNANEAALDNFVLGGYGLFNLGATIAGTDTILSIQGGTLDVKCQLAPSVYYVWDNNIVYVDGVGLTGAGYLFVAQALTYIIVEGDYAGYYIGNGALFVDTITDPYEAYVAEAGQLVDETLYGDGWNAIMALPETATEEEINAAYAPYEEAHTGTQFFQMDFDTYAQSFYYGNVSEATIVEGESELYYDIKLEWYDVVSDDRWFGLLVNFETAADGTETFSFANPYDMRYIHKQYTYWPLEEPEEEEPAEVKAVSVKKPLYISEKQANHIKNTRMMYKK